MTCNAPADETIAPGRPQSMSYARRMGDSELSYFLPSRADGVNDMYLHLGFRTTMDRMSRARVRVVWAILRHRHPLLASQVKMHDYAAVDFVYTPPASVEDCINGAEANLEFRMQSKDELIDSYLNGPRTLSSERLSYLVVSQPDSAEASIPSPPLTPRDPNASLPTEHIDHGTHEFELLICAMHFIGDGMALHTSANDFFSLLGGSLTQSELEETLAREFASKGSVEAHPTAIFPATLEAQLPSVEGKFQKAATKLTFQQEQNRSIGGHAFPRRHSKTRRTVVPTVSFDADRTKAMLKACKAHGVSISAALFALCNIAWARITDDKRDLPIMMYSALNLRPYFLKSADISSYWVLAVGYFNVVLPSFLPGACTEEAIFWHRARAAKEQSSRAAKNPLVAAHAQEMARLRGTRARAWAKEDDERERGTWVAPPPAAKDPQAKPRPPSAALIGLSLLGNLDGMYKHASYPNLHLHTLTTGSRQRPGGMLLFGYTFASKLWISLGYDENGFDEDVVRRFWDAVSTSTNEFLGV